MKTHGAPAPSKREAVWVAQATDKAAKHHRNTTGTQIQEQTVEVAKEIPQEIDVEKLMDEDVDEMILETDVGGNFKQYSSGANPGTSMVFHPKTSPP